MALPKSSIPYSESRGARAILADTEPPMTIADPPADARPAIDEIRHVGGDELVRELAATFLRFAAARVPRLQEAAESGDLETGAIIAHTLKASSRQFGAIALGEACASAELAARGGDAAGFLSGAAEAMSAFERTRPWMQRLAATA